MPALDHVEAFIARVEGLDHVGAIEDFYHTDATMQENMGAMRTGIDALVAGERAALERMGGPPKSTCTRFAIHGDTVFINWTFEMPNGKVLDEIAVQTWRGDRIQTERFYYDPGTMR
ncbi:MAG: nuclear transport factor 2 family protein [Alphaproteobacteria bacterium]|nr:nuclear transport factor 2 family protein [Alphaproteobacteria bacterium]